MTPKMPKNARSSTMSGNGRAYCFTVQTFRGWRPDRLGSTRPATKKLWLYRYENGKKAGRAVLVNSEEAARRLGAAWIFGGPL